MDTLPEDLGEKIYRFVFAACVDEMSQMFSRQCEHVSVYSEGGRLYSTYDPCAPSYNPFDRNITMGKGVFMQLTETKHCPKTVKREFDGHYACFLPDLTRTMHSFTKRQSVHKRPYLEMSDFEF